MRERYLLPLVLAASLPLAACDATTSDPTPYQATPIVEQQIPTAEQIVESADPSQLESLIRKSTSAYFSVGASRYSTAVIVYGGNVGMLTKGVIDNRFNPQQNGEVAQLVMPELFSEVVDSSNFRLFGRSAYQPTFYHPSRENTEILKTQLREGKIIALPLSNSLPERGDDLLITGLYGLQDSKVVSVKKDKFSVLSNSGGNITRGGSIVLKVEDGVPKVAGFIDQAPLMTASIKGQQAFIQDVTPFTEDQA